MCEKADNFSEIRDECITFRVPPKRHKLVTRHFICFEFTFLRVQLVLVGEVST